MDLPGDLRRRVRGDVLLHLEAPQVGGPSGGELPREHHGRDHLDHHSVPHPGRHGLAGDQDGDRDEGHLQRRPHHQGHRLPVEVGLRLPEGRRRGHQLPLQPCHPAGADRECRAQGRELPARGRQPPWSCRSARRSASSHRQRRDPRLVGAGASASSRTRFPASCATPGSRPRSPAPIAASAPSCAARSTASCRSSSKW